MAINTDIKLRNKTIYSIYVRNHTKEGTFKAVISDLDRIKDLGIDIIWFMPVHPIGQVNKKGSLGCPYSIQDYRKVNPEYGTLEDFKELIDEIHKCDMKVIIDVVYNHTSHNSALYNEHPEFFYRKADGNVGNKVGDWSDIIDLDYNNKELYKYQIDTLKYWTNFGIDGFRCDVAPMVPLSFWLEARKEVEQIKPDSIWLAETVDPFFMEYLRMNSISAASDSEIYQAFDVAYDYDTSKFLLEYLRGNLDLEYLLEKKRIQEIIYPANYVKLRYLENHDNPRAYNVIPNKINLLNWTAFMLFERGAALIYAGQETLNTHTPSLFDKDDVDWSNNENEVYTLIKRMVSIKKKTIFSLGAYEILKNNKKGVIEARYLQSDEILIGIFNVESKVGEYKVLVNGVPLNGNYFNIIDNELIKIVDGIMELSTKPVILEIK